MEWISSAILLRFSRLGSLTHFVVKVIGSLPFVVFCRGGEFIRQFERVSWGTFPIVVVAGLSIGVVTWLQTRRLLVPYGAESLLPGILATAVLVETGPILAGLLVAGRMGAGLAAELSSMSLTEELEARSVLGAAEIPTLTAPRVLACVVALPLLTVVLDGCAVGGGLIAEWMGGTLTAQAYIRQAFLFLHLSDVIPATLKTGCFGFLIGLIGCWTGRCAERSTEAVGLAATRGVIRSMIAVFVADVVMVPWIQAGMAALSWKF